MRIVLTLDFTVTSAYFRFRLVLHIYYDNIIHYSHVNDLLQFVAFSLLYAIIYPALCVFSPTVWLFANVKISYKHYSKNRISSVSYATAVYSTLNKTLLQSLICSPPAPCSFPSGVLFLSTHLRLIRKYPKQRKCRSRIFPKL